MTNQTMTPNSQYITMEEQATLEKVRLLTIDSQRRVIAIGLPKLAERLYWVELEIEHVLERRTKVIFEESEHDTTN